MPLTAKAQYALRALVSVAQRKGEFVKLHEIAEEEAIPEKFLEQIFLELRRSGWIAGKPGASGGYRLNQSADSISIGDVVRFFEGQLALVSCVSKTAYHRCTCPDESMCGLRTVLLQARDAVAKVLEDTTLHDVCDRTRRLRTPGGQRRAIQSRKRRATK